VSRSSFFVRAISKDDGRNKNAIDHSFLTRGDFAQIIEEMTEDLHPSLRNIVEQESLNWIFVGGKGL